MAVFIIRLILNQEIRAPLLQNESEKNVDLENERNSTPFVAFCRENLQLFGLT